MSKGEHVMTEEAPTRQEIEKTIGTSVMPAWDELTKFVETNYSHEPIWDDGGKYGKWEVKYRRSGRTLCAFYVKEGCFTVLVVLGKAEREKFELSQTEFCSSITELYDNTRQYHDGKWLWINVSDMSLVEDIKKLIVIKRKTSKHDTIR
jgi:hypothetical protein